RRDPERAAVAVNDLLRGVIALADCELRPSQARLRLELADGLPPVLADPIQVEQVVLNLLRNGLEAMADTPPGERELTLRTALTPRGVEVTVADAGCGLSPGAAERLFTPFFTTKPHGMGLGLAVSQSIVQAHGGRLWATPRPPHPTLSPDVGGEGRVRGI